MQNLKTIIVVLISIFFIKVNAQDSIISNNLELAMLKLQLLESKIQLFELKVESLEALPDQLNQWVYDLEGRISGLDYQSKKISKRYSALPENLNELNYSTSVKVNFLKLMESALEISYEKSISNRWSLEVSPMFTYATRNGFSGAYLKNQDFEVYNASTGRYQQLSGEMLSGFGITVLAKQYLLADINQNLRAPIGLYAAPQLMYRKIFITGKTGEYVNDEYVEKEVKQKLDVFSGGVLLGYKFTILKVLSLDIYAGGLMRLSQYENEDKFTKYKHWRNVDYSGVLPTIGIQIGILK